MWGGLHTEDPASFGSQGRELDAIGREGHRDKPAQAMSCTLAAVTHLVDSNIPRRNPATHRRGTPRHDSLSFSLPPPATRQPNPNGPWARVRPPKATTKSTLTSSVQRAPYIPLLSSKIQFGVGPPIPNMAGDETEVS